MRRSRYSAEEIINKLREADVALAQRLTAARACRKIGISDQTYYRWRREFGGMKVDQANRLKELKKHDEIVTSGGVYGTIVSVDEHIVTLQIAKEVRIKVRRTSIFDLASEPEPTAAPAKGAKKAEAKG